jgi:hypothetical protein
MSQSLMKSLQHYLLWVGLALQLGLILLGARRESIRVCYSFYLYLVVGLVCSVLVSYVIGDKDSRRFFYVVKELGLDAIKAALLLELNTRVFRFYPRVRRSNFLFFIVSAVLLVIYAWVMPQDKSDWWGSVPLDLHSKIMQATCLVFFVFAGSILFYRLQIDSRHKFLMLGFLFSQFPLALGYATAATFGETATRFVNPSSQILWVLALLIWTRVYYPKHCLDDKRAKMHA